VSVFFTFLKLSVPLKIHFGRRANPFGSGQRQTKTALSSDKTDLLSLPEAAIGISGTLKIKLL
jgi:hypothetical protein